MSEQTDKIKIPMAVMIFIWVSLMWNLLGVMNFFFQLTVDAQALAQMTEAQRQMYEATPGWLTALFGIAVVTGLAGSGMLMFKMAKAAPVLLISLIAVVAQMAASLIVLDAYAVLGASALIMPAIVTLWAIVLVLISRRGVAKGWFY
ncbi:hypothetical protein L2750_01670 [Shewanella submarina]|uniref:Sugar transporter n=1 Tax=Shewanella submarina TaxID=2016376 RepID=A0ABV7GKG1_9GAMM|nr:hypothetical protein [Shewanella submarina]MCL1035867.1 hypothetical protein [Shewanella submarina]